MSFVVNVISEYPPELPLIYPWDKYLSIYFSISLNSDAFLILILPIPCFVDVVFSVDVVFFVKLVMLNLSSV